MDFYSIEAIAERLASQDSDTAYPIYVVQRRERVTGIDVQWTEDVTWIDEEGEVAPSNPDWAEAEAHYQETDEEPWGWTRTGYVDRWVSVQPFFTQEAAERFIAENATRPADFRVYIDSAYRNKEWQAVVALLAKLRLQEKARRLFDDEVPPR